MHAEMTRIRLFASSRARPAERRSGIRLRRPGNSLTGRSGAQPANPPGPAVRLVERPERSPWAASRTRRESLGASRVGARLPESAAGDEQSDDEDEDDELEHEA